MDLPTYLRSLRVDVQLPPPAIADVLHGGITCQCEDCRPLKRWFAYDPKATSCNDGLLNLCQCSIVIKQAIGEYCDGCLEFGQLVNRRVGQILHFADLPARAGHQLDEAQAVERDRLDSRRITLWFERSLACHVGAARAHRLVVNVLNTPFTLRPFLEEHNDEYGLAFSEPLRATVRHAAKVYLEHYGHLIME